MNTNPTKSWRYKLGRYLLKSLGFHVAMIKISDGTITVEGDKELLKYTDITGYTFKNRILFQKRNEKKELPEIYINNQPNLSQK